MPTDSNETKTGIETRAAVRNYLNFLKNAGFLCLVPSGRKRHDSAHSRAERLEVEHKKAGKCVRCRLAQGRAHVVFGEGNPDADVMFIGEAPGQEEDLQARPFVGRAGKLLDSMIKQVGLRREDVYITNVNKCRPPNNRDPEPDEVEACRLFLFTQIELIEPKVIVALGRFAAHSLAGNQTPIMKMRGRFFLFHDVKVMPTLHPAAILRNMNYLDLAIEDLRRAVHAAAEMKR
jgi:DNA polymerase